MKRALLTACALAAVACHHGRTPAGPPPPPLAMRLGTADLQLRTPRTLEEENQGLMGEKTIPDDGGMLFDMRDRDEHPFVAMWMKNCPIPMDMVFIGPKGDVQKILTASAEPEAKADDKGYPLYTAKGQLNFDGLTAAYRSHALPMTDWVVELRAGRAKEIGLREGMVLGAMPRLKWIRVWRSMNGQKVKGDALRVEGVQLGDEA